MSLSWDSLKIDGKTNMFFRENDEHQKNWLITKWLVQWWLNSGGDCGDVVGRKQWPNQSSPFEDKDGLAAAAQADTFFFFFFFRVYKQEYGDHQWKSSFPYSCDNKKYYL